MNIRNRIKEFRTVSPDEVAPNPRNWRQHPQNQRDALRGVLAQVGIAAPVIAYETPQGLMLIDGHERMTVGVPFPCAILDVDEQEAATLLATLDPLSAMARTDAAALDALLRDVSTDSPAVAAMLDDLAQRSGVVPGEPVDPADLWRGMPEFEQEDQESWKKLIVHFDNEQDYEAFARLVEQTLTPKTKFIWYPYKAPKDLTQYTVGDES